MSSKQLAVPKAGGKALSVLSEELKRLAVDESANVPAAGGSFISTKGRRFTFQDEVLPDPMTVIVVDHALSNSFYADGYEEGNPQPPDCWSIGKTEKELAPLAELPGRVHATCVGCPNNEFGSAERGKGKACKNGRILAVLIVDGQKKVTAKLIEDAEVAYLRLSPTAMKPFNGYLRRVTGTLSKPLFTVVTQMTFDRSDYPVVLPTFLGELGDEAAIRAIMDKRQTIQDELLAGYPQRTQSDDDAPRTGRKGQKALPAPKRGSATAAKGGKGKAGARGSKF